MSWVYIMGRPYTPVSIHFLLEELILDRKGFLKE